MATMGTPASASISKNVHLELVYQFGIGTHAICQHCLGNNRGFKAGSIIACGMQPCIMIESKTMTVAQRDCQGSLQAIIYYCWDRPNCREPLPHWRQLAPAQKSPYKARLAIEQATNQNPWNSDYKSAWTLIFRMLLLLCSLLFVV